MRNDRRIHYFIISMHKKATEKITSYKDILNPDEIHRGLSFSFSAVRTGIAFVHTNAFGQLPKPTIQREKCF